MKYSTKSLHTLGTTYWSFFHLGGGCHTECGNTKYS